MSQPTFPLKMLFGGITAVAASLAVLTAKPSWLSGLAMMLLATAFPPVCFIGAKVGGHYVRAFCVGAFAPATTAAVFIAFSLVTINGPQAVTLDECLAVVAMLAEFYRFLLAFFWGSMPVVGLACMAAFWMFKSHET